MFSKRNFSANDVQKVVVRLATDEVVTVNNREMPDICLQHMVAVMLLDKTVTFAATHDRERMKDPAVLRQRAKIELLSDPQIDARRPLRECFIDVTLNDGTQMHEYVKDVRGTSWKSDAARRSGRQGARFDRARAGGGASRPAHRHAAGD